MAKFNVGDRVKCVRVVCNNELVVGKIGTIIEGCDLFTHRYGVEFDEYICGHSCGYVGKKNHCWWCKESELVKVVCSDKIVITTDGKTTTAKMYDGKKVVKTAIAKCSPEDEFDIMTGTMIALSRLFDSAIRFLEPFDWDAFKNDELFVQVTKDNFDEFIEEAEKHDCFFHNNNKVNPFKYPNLMKTLFYALFLFEVSGADKKQTAPDNSVFIGYKDNAIRFTLFNAEDKPVYTW